MSSEELLWSGGGGGGGEEKEGGGGEEGWSEELEALIRQEQQTAVNESLQRLQTGLNEAKVGGSWCECVSLCCSLQRGCLYEWRDTTAADLFGQLL